MTERSTLDRISMVIVDSFSFKPAELGADKRLIEDLHLDSLDLFELASGLEGEFEVDIPDGIWETGPDQTLAQVAEIIDQLVATLPSTEAV